MSYSMLIKADFGNEKTMTAWVKDTPTVFSWRDSPRVGLGLLLIHEGFCGFEITHNDTPQSVGLLWTSEQLVAETSTWQHTTLTTDSHPFSRWGTKPRSQQASGRIPTP